MGKCLIEIKKGSKVQHIQDGTIGEVVDIKLSPNGVNDPSLVAILFVKTAKGFMSATSNRFKIIEEEQYEELYPTVHLNQLSEDRVKRSFEYKTKSYQYLDLLTDDLNRNPEWEPISITVKHRFEGEGYHVLIKSPAK